MWTQFKPHLAFGVTVGPKKPPEAPQDCAAAPPTRTALPPVNFCLVGFSKPLLFTGFCLFIKPSCM